MSHRLFILVGLLAVFLLPFASVALAERDWRPPAAPSAVFNYPGSAPCNTTLQACISGVAAGNTINVAANTYVTNQLIITRAIVLQGAGPAATVLQALGAQRVISVGANIAAGVTIANLRVFSGSLTSGSGLGAGLSAGAGTPLTLLNVDVLSNTNSVNSGGGIYAGDALTMTNVNVIGNRDPGGAGGGLRASSSVIINGGVFERNTSLNPGGALRVDGPLTMTGVTVISNSTTAASTNGGGVRADGGLFMLGGLVQNNMAQGSGGGILATGPAIISATAIISNAADNGGGLWATDTLTMFNALLDRNTARAGHGGSIYATGNVTIVLGGTSSVSKTLISNSSAITHGGGVYAAGVLLVGAVTFNSNDALTGEGGALYATSDIRDNSGTSVLLVVNFTGNTAQGHGGAVRALGSVSLLNSPAFQNNLAGGGTAADGGAVYADGNVFLSRGSSTGNSARNGGAVYALGNVTFNVHDTGPNSAALDGGCAYALTSVTYNSADAVRCVAGHDGGAAYSPLTVTLSANGVGLFSSNRAVNAGGTALGSLVNVRSATIMSSTAPLGGAVVATRTANIQNSALMSNTAAIGGGALVVLSGTATITSSLIRANVVTSTATLAGAVLVSGTAHISGTTFERNVASRGNGGALAVRGQAFITSSIFLTNSAPLSSGGAYAGSPLTVTASHFQGNSASFAGVISTPNILLVSSVFTGNRASVFGGVLTATAATVTGSRFISNSAGGFCNNFCGGGTLFLKNGNIADSYFEGNAADEDGSAVFAYAGINITNSQFIRNGAAANIFGGGSAVFLAGGTGNVVDSLFDGNVDDQSVNGGGALDAPLATLNVMRSQFDNNRAWDGGAIRAQNAVVMTSTFFNNVSQCCGAGGAIWGGSINIQNSTFISNYADCCDGGGAVFGGTISAYNSQFISNSVESRMDGGAIYAQGSLYAESSTFEGNFVIIDTSGNPAFNRGRGGAVYVRGSNFGNGDAFNSTFRRNRANHGGAMACDGHCRIDVSLFEGNIADKLDDFTASNIGTGGAIQTTSDLEVYRSRFVRNRAGVAGGAIYESRQVLQFVPDAMIQNSLFAENLASNSVLGSTGSAIAITGTVSNGKLYYNTIVSDSLTAGSAVAILSGTVSVMDNIITNHAVGIVEGANGNVFENFNLFFGNTANISGTVLSGGSSFAADPLFVSPATDNYRLQASSPAINAATDVLVTVDFDGQTRPTGGGFDIGFDERVQYDLYLPLIRR